MFTPDFSSLLGTKYATVDLQSNGSDNSTSNDNLGSTEKVIVASPFASKRLHVASIKNIPTTFTKIGSGFYRNAHAVWELRKAEDGPGHVLVVKREERNTDFRGKVASADSGVVKHTCLYKCAQCSCSGIEAEMPTVIQEMMQPAGLTQPYHDVQQANVIPTVPTVQEQPQIIVIVKPIVDEPGDVEDPNYSDDNGCLEDEEQFEVPSPRALDLCDSGHCPCKCHNDAELEVHDVGFVEPNESSDDSDAESASSAEQDDETSDDNEAQDRQSDDESTPESFKHNATLARQAVEFNGDSWGQLVVPTHAFIPKLMGGGVHIDPAHGDCYTLEGMAAPGPADRTHSVPGQGFSGVRYRLVDAESGKNLFVTEAELNKFFRLNNTAPERSKSDEDMFEMLPAVEYVHDNEHAQSGHYGNDYDDGDYLPSGSTSSTVTPAKESTDKFLTRMRDEHSRAKTRVGNRF